MMSLRGELTSGDRVRICNYWDGIGVLGQFWVTEVTPILGLEIHPPSRGPPMAEFALFTRGLLFPANLLNSCVYLLGIVFLHKHGRSVTLLTKFGPGPATCGVFGSCGKLALALQANQRWPGTGLHGPPGYQIPPVDRHAVGDLLLTLTYSLDVSH